MSLSHHHHALNEKTYQIKHETYKKKLPLCYLTCRHAYYYIQSHTTSITLTILQFIHFNFLMLFLVLLSTTKELFISTL